MPSSLGHLAATVSLDINPFKASNGVLKAEIRSTANALRAQEAALRGSQNSINNMRAVYATMASQMRNYNAQLQRSKALMDDSTKSERARANAANQFNKTSAQVEVLRSKMQALSREIEVQASRWGQLSARAAAFGNTAKKVGSAVQSAGRGMSTYLSAPIAAGLGYASKQLIDFQDAMNRTKNVIRTSGESATQTQRSYNQMLRDSRKYSDEYGVSQIKIANGYQDLVKRGYPSRAAVGVMRNELKASIATGDDFNDVIKDSSQIMESFGLSTTKAGKPIKNARLMEERSRETLNKLAYTADATSTNFNSLSVGMSYVGATAHQAGFTLGETASAMGILSNNGLEADKAGTGLRKVIQSLITPTASGQKALAKVNLSTKDFLTKSGKLKSMSAIFGTLNKHMKGLSGHEKNDIFHALFGTTGQQAGAILTENAKRLRELTKEVDNAGKRDYIGDLSKRNLNTPKAQLAIFKESLTNAGMDIAKNVLPTITPLVQDVSKLAQSFGKLPGPVKKAIATFTLFTAGAGPLLLLIGKLTSGVGNLALRFASIAGGLGRARVAISNGATGMTVLRSAFSKGAFETANFGKETKTAGSALSTFNSTVGTVNGTVGSAKTIVGAAGSAIATTGESATVAGSAFGAAAIGVGVAAVAIGAGAIAWELWGKKAAVSADRASRWGSDVGAAADRALSKMQSTSQGIQAALSDLDVASHTSTKKMADDFDKEFSQIEDSARKHFSNVKKAEEGLSPEVKAAIDKETANEKKQYNSLLSDADQARTRATTILKTTNKSVADLSATQRTMLRNNQQQMLNDELKILNVSGGKRRAALAALNNDISHMTKQQRSRALGDLTSETADMQEQYQKQNKLLRQRYKSGQLNRAEYQAGLRANSRALSSYTRKAAAEYIRLAKANGESTSLIKKDLKSMGLSYKAGTAEIRRQTKAAMQDQNSLAINTTKMSGKMKKAANMWNNLVFDPKTGKVRTNAQEEVNKAVNSSKQWNQIKLLAKHGKLTSNASGMVAKALLANGKWNSMSWKQQQLFLKDNATKTVVHALEKSGEWNKLSLKQQEAIVRTQGTPQFAKTLLQTGAWNSLTLKQQEAVIKDKATKPIYEALQKSGQWNKLSLKQKTAIINAKGTPQLISALNKAKVWNSLSMKQQTAILRSRGTAQLVDALTKSKQWNRLTLKQQRAIIHTQGGSQLNDALTKYKAWKGMPAATVKKVIAHDLASGNIRAAYSALMSWRRANPGAAKNARANNLASGPLGIASGSIVHWRGTNVGPAKIAKAADHASSVIQKAISLMNKWKTIGDVTHYITTVFRTIGHPHKGKAMGTNYWEGGPVMVNDQKGPVFREMVQFPGETPFIPFGRNVVLDAPRGTKVVKASDTLRQFPHLPQFANGNSDAVSVLSNLSPDIRSQQVVNNSNSYVTNNQTGDSSMKEMVGKMDELIGKFGTMLGLNAAQLSAIKASAFDKDQLYGTMGKDQVYFDAQQLQEVTKISANVLYIKIDDQKEVASDEITGHLIFLGLTESPSLLNNYRDDTMLDGQLWNYSRYGQTTVTAKFLLQFIDRRDFKIAKHQIYRVLAQKGIYRLRTGVEPNMIRYCRVGAFEIKSDPEEPNYCTFEVPFENPSGLKLSKLHSDQMTKEDFSELDMNEDMDTHNYHFVGQKSFEVFNGGDITVDAENQRHDFKITMKHNGDKFSLKNETTNTSWSYNQKCSNKDTLVLQGRTTYKNNNFDSANTDYGYLTLAPGINKITVTGADDLDITFSFPFMFLGQEVVLSTQY